MPELQSLCSEAGFGENDLTQRLREFLGLYPTATIVAFVEMWVKSSDLFRPAPDNEITDTKASLNFPKETEDWYRKWFNDLRAKQYFQSATPKHNPYPWTQLGYTYDWGNPETEIGASGFVVKANSEVV